MRILIQTNSYINRRGGIVAGYWSRIWIKDHIINISDMEAKQDLEDWKKISEN